VQDPDCQTVRKLLISVLEGTLSEFANLCENDPKYFDVDMISLWVWTNWPKLNHEKFIKQFGILFKDNIGSEDKSGPPTLYNWMEVIWAKYELVNDTATTEGVRVFVRHILPWGLKLYGYTENAVVAETFY
jgi:hypothetical protein